MSHKKELTVFDTDSHIVEPVDIWEVYLDQEYRILGKSALWRHEGENDSYLKVNGKMFRDTSNSNIPRHAIWKPGMTWEDVGYLDPGTRHELVRGSWDPHARLSDMDEMGVNQSFLYPTWFGEGFHLIEDPDVAYALARAYNDWITDFCAADPDRLFAAAMLPLQNMDFTLAELRRISAIHCFRGAYIRPMFIEGRYFTHPYYDPLWSELEQLRITAAIHPTPGLWNPEWTSHGPYFEKIARRLGQAALLGGGGGGPFAGGGINEHPAANGGSSGTALGHPISPILSYWLDNHLFAASTLIGYTVMQRYPKMKTVLAHSKASWLEELLEKMEASTRVIPPVHYYPVRTDPEQMWDEGEILVGFDAEERMIHARGSTYARRVVWGSRYPHHDTTSAWDAIDTLTQAGLEPSYISDMMANNALMQFGLNPT